jgi:hypothetical protein
MEQSQEYIKGFNNGYKMAKYKPELVEQMGDSIKGVNDYEKGLLGGIKEYQQEQEKLRIDELLDIRKSKGKGKDRDITR